MTARRSWRVATARTRRPWLTFTLWMIAGAGYAMALLGALSVGLWILVLSIVATTAAVKRRDGARPTLGLISGLGLPLIYVAWRNRSGPGNVCTTHGGGTTCIEEWAPWPWLVVGLMLLIGAGCVFLLLKRRTSSEGS